MKRTETSEETARRRDVEIDLAEEVMHQMKSNLKNLLAARADGADEADVADGPF